MQRNVTFQLILLATINTMVFGAAAIVFPDEVQRLFRHQWELVANYDLVRLGRYLTILAGCLLFEIPFLGWRNSSLYRLLVPSRSARHDLVVAGLVASGFGGIVLLFFTFGAVPVLPAVVRRVLGIEWVRGLDNHVLQFVIWFVVSDFLNYWYHRLLHMYRFGWELHKYHHAATEFTMLTGGRVHFLERAMHRVFECVPLALLGTPIEAYFVILVVRQTIELFQHSMVDWQFGWIGKWIIFSPVGHRIHHSMMPEHWDKNFGNILTLWDHLFGTWYDGSVINTDVGVTDNYFVEKSVWDGIFTASRRFLRQLIWSFRTGRWRMESSRRESGDCHTTTRSCSNMQSHVEWKQG